MEYSTDKIQVDRFTLNRALDHYRDTVMERFPNKLLTEGTLNQMRAFLSVYQAALQKREKSSVWFLPIVLTVSPKTRSIEIELDPQANVEIL